MLDSIDLLTKEIYRPVAGLSIQVRTYNSPFVIGDRTITPITETVRDGKRHIKFASKDFLVLHYQSRDKYEQIHISLSNISLFVHVLDKCIEYFDEDIYPGLYNANADNEWSVNVIDYPKAGKKVGGLGNNKSLFLFPEITSRNEKGVGMLLNDPDYYVEFNQREISSLAWVIDHLDIASISMGMIAFANTTSDRKTANPSLTRIGGRDGADKS
jgi:hypothetical protein